MKFWAVQRNGVPLRPKSNDSFLCSPIEVAIQQAILAGKDVCWLTHALRKRGLFGITSASGNCDPDRVDVIAQ